MHDLLILLQVRRHKLYTSAAFLFSSGKQLTHRGGNAAISPGELSMQTAYINRVATAVPPYDVHDAFRRFAQSLLDDDRRNSLLFQRMAKIGRAHV